MHQDQYSLENKSHGLKHLLAERVKELNCLYSVVNLIAQAGSDFETILKGVVDILPGSWQYPDTCCARIIYKDYQFESDGFKSSQWTQTATIRLHGQPEGTVEVCYLEERVVDYEGPFLYEERLLIDAVAEHIGMAAERIQATKQIEVERSALHRANITLREVLDRLEKEKKEIGKTIQVNIDKIVMPILFAIESEIPENLRKYTELLRKHLFDITSPFTKGLNSRFPQLTPVETQICTMIKAGLSTKEIAQLRKVSPATIHRQRESIRKKLGLTNQSTNLTTYLNHFNFGSTNVR